MASASSSQSTFRLGRSKKNPTVMDQIGKFFGGDKKKKGKGSFRGGLSASPQRSSASPRRRPDENAVVHFFRNIREQKSQSSTKGQKGRGDTLTRIFKSVTVFFISNEHVTSSFPNLVFIVSFSGRKQACFIYQALKPHFRFPFKDKEDGKRMQKLFFLIQ
uniref:Myelin basic protein n=1 Tax=Cyprinus carpio carpio TaxID=630221 RepID=A0A9J7XG82_CYPCA